MELQIIHNSIHRSQTFLWIFHTIYSLKFAFWPLKSKIPWGQNWLCKMLFGYTRNIISPPQAKISENLVARLGSNLAIKEHEQSSILALVLGVGIGPRDLTAAKKFMKMCRIGCTEGFLDKARIFSPL